ncbi:emp24 domain-containing protein 10 [Seminavis robusta]|uniref:Emp24 domain-containing protein 10 n=1 Tax=Seminavis robusta TaxID=568900 RepID=A0A9N8HAA2_9STRA|nr:emp24 domain-containing protein 10 [Seminavis robusta]CAB9522741.1 emp24 domain-containing protein 10 [Seminavis robusta]|eukprot:Sro1336_g263970.1 emp24 domain-containing protein 10 (297) ;mRNA; r:1278-2168
MNPLHRSSALLLQLLLSLACCWQGSWGYPLILQVSEQQERCFKFNIPEDDDAHLVFLALPLGEEVSENSKDGGAHMENWVVEQIIEMSNQRSAGGNLPTQLPANPPSDLKDVINKFLQGRTDGVTAKLKVVVSLDSAADPSSRVLPIKFFSPSVINKVREAHKKVLPVSADDDEDLSGYSICFDNKENEDESVQVVMDIVMLNGDPEEQDSNEPNFVKEKHLSPLEESLEKSIKAANTVLREMKYMTDREERMRHTADSINQRVQYFSMVSGVILLGVTYVQVTYLKRYFKKKKLM